MTRALQLAARACGRTSPNPLVGAVIVKSGRVLAEGYHKKAGTAHAEVIALKEAGRRAKGATLYVTLEPCCHTGHTGPCCEAIIRAGITRVVLALSDPDPRVNGKGIRRLQRAGIKVDRGLLKKEAERLNEAYLGYHRNRRPYVTLKLAQTIDGRIATSSGDSQWLSSPPSLKIAHKLRAENDAVLVGMGTVRADNPALTVRRVKGRNPYRVVVTSGGRFPKPCRLIDDNQDLKTVIATTPRTAERLMRQQKNDHLTYWEVRSTRDRQLDMHDLLVRAGEFGVQSLLVEGGARLATSFLMAGLVDKYVVTITPKILGRGTEAIGDLKIHKLADCLQLKNLSVAQAGPDTVISGYL